MTGKDNPSEGYGATATAYFRAGWQPLPLPAGRKEPPPSGYTGADGEQIGSIRMIERWARDPGYARGNLALRLLHPFVGIDVDTYGEKAGAATLEAAQAELGQLPPTLISSARADPLVSGIRIYRLPQGSPRLTGAAGRALAPYAARVVEGRPCPDVDIISMAHRYLVAWPSVHPKGGTYRWYRHRREDLQDLLALLDGVPLRDDVADLPDSWARALAGDGGTKNVTGAAGEGARSAQSTRKPVSQQVVDELGEMGLELADASVRLYTPDVAEDEIGTWLARLRTTRRGTINDVLKDTAAHLWHFVPHFVDAEAARRMLVEAQRDAWIGSGGKDDHDYSAAEQTINRTIATYVPQQARFGLWWTAMPDDEDGEGQGKAQVSETIGDDPSDFNEPETHGASPPRSGDSTPSDASSGADPDLLALRERRRQEKRERIEAERFAELLLTERMRRRARAVLDEEEAAHGATDADIDAFDGETLDEDSLGDLPPMQPLIGRDPLENDEDTPGVIKAGADEQAVMLWQDTTARFIGPGGSYKSFLMLSMAAFVARGLPWMGYATPAGGVDVLYVMSESQRGVEARYQAIRDRFDLAPSKNFRVHPKPVQLTGPEWPRLVGSCKRRETRMVILDTQAKMTVGHDESSSTETGRWLERAEWLRRETGACVVLVHHSGWDVAARRGRGSSASEFGVDTEWWVERDEDAQDAAVRLQLTRQKEGPEFGEDEWLRFGLVKQGRTIVVDVTGASRRASLAAQVEAEIKHLEVASENWATPVLAALVTLCREGTPAPTRAEVKETTGRLLKLKITGASVRSRYDKAFRRILSDGLAQADRGGTHFWPTRDGAASRGRSYVPAPWESTEDDEDGAGGDQGAVGGDFEVAGGWTFS